MARLRHVLALPLPAQGHIAPLLKLALWIAEHGVKVTFVNTIVNQDKLMSARPELFEDQSKLRFVALPDGMDSNEERVDPNTWLERYPAAVSPRLQELIKKINDPDGGDEKIDCVIGDVTAGWALEVAESLGIEAVGFWVSGAFSLLLLLHIPKLIKDGVIDEDGTPLHNSTIQISDKIPAWSIEGLPWSSLANPALQRTLFGFVKAIIKYVKHTKTFLCNTFMELEPSSFEIIPGILPVGPLMATSDQTGSLWTEDSTCLDWLDEQGEKTVVYVALGSTTVLTRQQFEELVAGLEDMGRPFLWVVRPGLLNGGSPSELLDGFLERVKNRAKIVEWAPQERVLAHKSTACFLSHCGWGSTLEGISNGMPFICLPYIADHYQDSLFICDVWKVGVKLVANEDGLVTRQEVKEKIAEVLGNDKIIENSSKMMKMARESVSKEGSSTKNLADFIENRCSNL